MLAGVAQSRPAFVGVHWNRGKDGKIRVIEEKMPVKHCAWGTCNSGSRYRESCEGVRFVPFTKPKQGLQKCIRWIKACGRPQIQFNVGKITKWTYICTKVNTSILFSWCVVRIVNVSNAGLPAPPTPLSLYGVHSASLAGWPRLVRSAQWQTVLRSSFRVCF